jgi:16S rRNA (guanine(966)-N(2))-methyltransferase RsmD
VTRNTPARHRGAPQRVRIIGGAWKRTPLAVSDVPGLRPTPDRVRETLFNWLVHLRPDLASASAADLFAGTGALGFELASRGARAVTLVESDARALAALHATRTRLAAAQVQILAGDALALAAHWPAQSLDIVLLDPPFDSGLQAPALAAARRVVRADGLVYLEAPAPLAAAEARAQGFEIVRAGRAGRVAFHLLRPAAA